ncbi:hypothetical protein ACF07Y_37110 [Streptomyces sp. NPDC016566]|uniref:hypothetical protein n=1 Tax=Streptomyces sp. NPDC016566 TaxID=3364967 RepID=UPI0036FFCCD4
MTLFTPRLLGAIVQRLREIRAAHQSRWERTALASLLGLAELPYKWGKAHADPYYTAAVRSMTVSCHTFLYGGLGPNGSISVDTVPAGLWP